MKEISHTQAQRWLAVGQTELAPAEQEALTAHLAQCTACRTYASETHVLQQNLTRLLQARWDGKQPTMTRIHSAKNTAPNRRLNFVGTLVGAGAMAALAVALMFFFNRAPVQQPAAGIGRGNVQQWQPAILKTEAISALAFSTQANVLAVGYRDGRLELVEADTGQVRFSMNVGVEVIELAFAPTGGGETLAALTRAGAVSLWAVDITQSALTLMGAPLSARDFSPIQIALSPDGSRLATLETNNSVKIFNAQPAPGEAPQVQIQFDAAGEGVFMGDMAFSPDGQRLAVVRATSTEVQIYNLASGAVAHEFSLPDNLQGLFVNFTPDGQKLVVGGNPNAYLYDLANQQLLVVFSGNPTFLTALRLSLDGNTLATAADNDQSLRLWDVASGQLLREVQFADPVHSLDFSADGQWLAVLWYGADGAQLEIWSAGANTAETPTPAPLPTLETATPPPTPVGSVSDVSVIWSPVPQTTPLPASGFTFGAELTYSSDQETIAHIVAFPLLANEIPQPCENRAMPEGRLFWADQTNFPPGTHIFNQSFPYAADAFPNAAYLVVRVNVLDTAVVSNLLNCQQQVYALEQIPLTDVPFATWTPCPVGVVCETPTPFPTFTPCVIGCETPPPFVTIVPSATPCQIGCPESTATPPPLLPSPTPTPAAENPPPFREARERRVGLW